MSSQSTHPYVAYLMSNVEPGEVPVEEIETILNNPPTDKDDDNVAALVGFISGLIRLIIVWVTTLINPIETRLASLVKATPGSWSSKAFHASSTTSQSTLRNPGRKVKCAKCHARGHSAEECRSTDPQAVRRRIAQNAKVRAERRKMPPLISALSAHTQHGAPYPPAVGIPPSQVAFLAESAELRRRIAQSNRDRRRSRRHPPPPP